MFLVCSWLVTPAMAQEITVKGVVVDNFGEPLMGVTVRVLENPSTGASTDFDGNFMLQAKKSDKLQFSFVGFKTQVVDLSTAALPLSITMQDGNLPMKMHRKLKCSPPPWICPWQAAMPLNITLP